MGLDGPMDREYDGQIWRRSIWLALICATLAMLALIGQSPVSAEAGVDYCASDPIIDIGRTRLNILVGIRNGRLDDITGDVLVEVEVPQGAPRTRIVFVDQSLFKQRVTIKQATDRVWVPGERNPIKIRVFVPGQGAIPAVNVNTKGDGSEHNQPGKFNRWIQTVHHVRG
jgi:hypothetical protein